MKISKKLKNYPISNYGNSKETEIYKAGFKRAIEVVKRLEKENKTKKICDIKITGFYSVPKGTNIFKKS